ncbi:MAG: helix-turn-helix domain-containing protein [Chitinivibrionales bacterium]|nr:helix-turn-helix domain-containing protein [Chitinivibrionales bacterium]
MDYHWLVQVSPYLHHAGFVRMRNGIINPWRQIDDHELFIFDDGAAKMVVRDQEYSFDSPWYIVIPPATRHISYCLSDAVDIYYCHFNWIYEEDFTTQCTTYTQQDGAVRRAAFAPDFVPNKLLYGRLLSPQALELHKRVVGLFSSGSVRGQLAARALFLQELVEVLVSPDEPGLQSAPEQIHAERVRQALTELAHMPFADAPPLKETMAGLGGSYFHLERLFKQRHGVGPHRYVSLIRVERAKTLLRQSDAPVLECARVLGYRDVGYFIRFFRKHVGVSPLRYREDCRRPDAIVDGARVSGTD